MSEILYDATIKTYDHFLLSLEGLLDKVEAHARESGGPVETLCAARLSDNMWDFAKQIEQCCHHSQGAVEGLRQGEFSPLGGDVPHDLTTLRTMLSEARAFLSTITPAELDQLARKDLNFLFSDRRLPFTAKDFLLGFSIPNFYFHVTTAYDILRNQGVSIAKRDFLGKLPLKKA